MPARIVLSIKKKKLSHIIGKVQPSEMLAV